MKRPLITVITGLAIAFQTCAIDHYDTPSNPPSKQDLMASLTSPNSVRADLFNILKHAIESDNLEALSRIVTILIANRENICTLPIDQEGHTTLSYALEQGANNSVIWLCTCKEAFIPFKELPALVQRQNETALCSYLNILFENSFEKEDDEWIAITTLYRQAKNLGLFTLADTCVKFIIHFSIFPTIEIDDLEKVKEAYALFNGQLPADVILSYALKHNAKRTAKWITTEYNAKMPLLWYRHAIRPGNAAIIQKYFAQELASFNYASFSKNMLKVTLSELETNLLQKIQDLPEGEVRISWNIFYHENVQPIVNAIRDRLGYPSS